MKSELKVLLKAGLSVLIYFLAFLGILVIAKASGVEVESEPWNLLVLMGYISMIAIFAGEIVIGLEEDL